MASRSRALLSCGLAATLLAFAGGVPAAVAQSSVARVTIVSEPADAIVSVVTKAPPLALGTFAKRRPEDRQERILGRTPMADVEIPAGPAEVVVAKDGYVLKVEPLELQAGTAQRLEVRLTKDIPVPRGISFKDAQRIVGNATEGQQLLDMVLSDVLALFVDEKDPRALIDAGVKTLVEACEAVREREALLRRELGEAARFRFYSDEVDLRAYPPLAWSETELTHGRKRWSLAAGSLAVEGVTDPGEYETYRRKLHAVISFLKNRWDLDAKLDDSMLVQGCIEGILGSLDDVHTHFLGPNAVRDMGDETSGHFGGVGVVVGAREGGAITVIASMEGTPGEKAGLLPGDRILAIDGRATEGMLLSEAVKLMRGDPGTRIELTVRRGDAAPVKHALVRADIQVKHVKHQLLPVEWTGGTRVGYVKIASFMSEKLEEDVSHALDALEGDRIEGLVIDLRNDPGGLLQKAIQIADMFVPEKATIVSTRGRIALASNAFVASDGKKRAKRPIAILVNEGSASASEILAGTLREHGLAVLVGERTFGKGSVQRVIPLEPFGSALALTVATYHLPSGMTPHKKGIEPDVVVKITDEEKVYVASRTVYSTILGDVRDRQLDAAIAEIKKRLAPAAPQK